MKREARHESGVAILVVLVSLAVLTAIVFALTYSTGVQSRLARTFHESGQAKYLAKSALNIDLLRLYMYINVLGLLKDTKLPLTIEDIAKLYSTPIPPFPFSPEIMEAFPMPVRTGFEKFAKESVMGKIIAAKFASDIRGLSGRLPLYVLDGEPERFSSGKIQEAYKNLWISLIRARADADPKWVEKVSNATPEEVMFGLMNYMDLDNLEQPSGNIEDAYFLGFAPPEFLRHRRIRFLVELSLPKSWNPFLAAQFAPLCHLFGFYPYLHANDIPREIWKQLLKDPNKDQLSAVSERVGTSWFSSRKDLEKFFAAQELSLSEAGEAIKPLLAFQEQVAFAIQSSGIIGDFYQTYTTVVVFQPADNKVQAETKRIQKLVLDMQRKIEAGAHVDDPDVASWREDPFHVFDKGKETVQNGKQGPQTSSNGTGQTNSSTQTGSAPSEQGKGIFDEPPEEMRIVHFGRPL